MSYTKIKNISIKKDKVTITAAESNIFPINYYTYESKWGTDLLRQNKYEQLIGEIVMDFLDGNFHSTNDKANRKFLYALTLNRAEIDRLQEIRWGWNAEGIRTSNHTDEERKQATEQLIKLLYQNYLIADKIDKEHKGKEYIIKLNCGYYVRPTKYGFTYSYYPSSAKKYNYLVAAALCLPRCFQHHISAKYEPTIVAA